LGKVRTEQIKRLARELVRHFPNRFSGNFEENKRVVAMLVPEATTRVRNQIAGYITHFYSGFENTSSTSEGEKESE